MFSLNKLSDSDNLLKIKRETDAILDRLRTKISGLKRNVMTKNGYVKGFDDTLQFFPNRKLHASKKCNRKLWDA